MPKNPMKGTKQVLMELPEGLVQDVKTFAKDRGQTFKDVTIEALKRHMAYPPPKPEPVPEPPPMPLPPVTAPAPPSPTATDLIRVDKAQESEETKLGKLDARAELANDEAQWKENGGKPKKPTPKGKPKK